MGQHGIARAEDAVVAEVDIDFLLEDLFQIDLGDDPEAFLLEAFNTSTHGLIKADRQRLAEIIAHRKLPFAVKTNEPAVPSAPREIRRKRPAPLQRGRETR